MPPPWGQIVHDESGQYFGQLNGNWVKLNPTQAQSLIRSKQPTNFEKLRAGSPSDIFSRNLGLGTLQGSGLRPPDPTDPNSLGYEEDGKQTLQNLLQTVKTSMKRMGIKSPLELVTLPGSVAVGSDLLAGGVEGLASNLESSGKDVLRSLFKTKDPVEGSQAFGRLLSAAGQTAGAIELPDAANAVSKIPESAGGAVRELTGRGPTMEKLDAGIDQTGITGKAVLTDWEKTARSDAQQPLNTAVSTMDQKLPEGVPRSVVSEQVKGIVGELNKIPEGLPEPLRILSAPTKSDLSNASIFGRASSEPLGEAAMLVRNLRRPGVYESVRRNINQFLESSGVQDAPVGADSDSWTYAQLQQLRSRVGDIVRGSKGSSLPGPIRAAATRVYSYLSDVMDDAAEKAGVAPTWELGNAKWGAYKRAWDGTWERGKFNRSPLAEALQGQTGDEIMGPLSGSSGQLARDYLNQYGALSNRYPELAQAIQQYRRFSTIKRMSHPQAYIYAMPLAAGFRGPLGYGMGAYGAARILTPAIWRWLATRGINPENIRNLQPIVPGGPQ